MEVDVVTDRASFEQAARDGWPTDEELPPPVRVPVELRVHVDDPFSAYCRARDDHGVFYETTGGQPGWGYFGVDPLAVTTVDEGALSRLAGLLARDTLARGDCQVPYPCGLFGWLSYDVARELERLPEETVDDRALPLLECGFFDTVAAWRAGDATADGPTTLHVTACPVVAADGAEDGPTTAHLDAAYEQGTERARALAARAVDGTGGDETPPVQAAAVRFESDCTREEFAERVRRVKTYIREGDTFQANISQRLRAPCAVHPVQAYAALREVNPAPYSGLVELPSCDLVSASPELLLRVEPADEGMRDDATAGTRLVTEPIAGTRPRGETDREDAALERDLLTDEKERAEHAMLVDLERNDLGKVSRYGSVRVPEYRRVDRYSEVMHLVSLVEGRLWEQYDPVDAIAATFPGGTITGAPKPRTMEIIDEVERTRRGPYTGSMFVAGLDGRATLNIVIRTLVRWDDEYHLRVGAGIVHDSDPDREYAETLDKGRALVRAIDAALETDVAVTDDDGENTAPEGEP